MREIENTFSFFFFLAGWESVIDFLFGCLHCKIVFSKESEKPVRTKQMLNSFINKTNIVGYNDKIHNKTLFSICSAEQNQIWQVDILSYCFGTNVYEIKSNRQQLSGLEL